jgi:signal peptidase I
MAPTIEAGDKIVVDMQYFHNGKPAPGDVVAFCHHDLILVKRIVAVGGSTISGKNEQVEIDGRQITEPYAVHGHPEEVSLGDLNNFGPIKLPAGQLFVMGDNRDESLDSRVRSGPSDYGPVFVMDVVGKAVYRFSSKLGESEYGGQKIK